MVEIIKKDDTDEKGIISINKEVKENTSSEFTFQINQNGVFTTKSATISDIDTSDIKVGMTISDEK